MVEVIAVVVVVAVEPKNVMKYVLLYCDMCVALHFVRHSETGMETSVLFSLLNQVGRHITLHFMNNYHYLLSVHLSQ